MSTRQHEHEVVLRGWHEAKVRSQPGWRVRAWLSSLPAADRALLATERSHGD